MQNNISVDHYMPQLQKQSNFCQNFVSLGTMYILIIFELLFVAATKKSFFLFLLNYEAVLQ